MTIQEPYHTALHTIIGLLPWILVLVVIPVGSVAAILWVIDRASGVIA